MKPLYEAPARLSKWPRRVIAAAFWIVIVVLLDVSYGELTGIADVRRLSGLFRSEASPYALHAAALRPDLKHQYPIFGSFDAFRQFRTDQFGTVLGPNQVGEADTRILFLGGSTTENNEVNEEYRFPAAVEGQLRAAGYDVRVVNGGVRGNTSQDSLIAYLSRPEFRRSDIVVLMHNINDRLWLARHTDYSISPSSSSSTTWAAVALSIERLAHQAWDFISYRSNALFFARSYITSFNPWTGERVPIGVVSERTLHLETDDAIKNIAAFDDNLRAFIAIVRSQGALPVLMTQPHGRTTHPQEVFNDHIRNIAVETGSVLVDLARALDGQSQLFLGDGVHFNDDGSRRAALIIFQSLLPTVSAMTDTLDTHAISTEIYDSISRCAESSSASPQKEVVPFQILATQGRYPTFSQDGEWLVFQTRIGDKDQLSAFQLARNALVDVSDLQLPFLNERHPAVLVSSSDELTLVFGRGFDPEQIGLERLMVRHWPSGKTMDLGLDQSIGGAIPAVEKGILFFPAFGSEGIDTVPDLASYDLDDEEFRLLTKTPFEEWRPAISSDGTIYYIANAEGNFDIYSLSANSSDPTLIFGSPADEWDPAVSPDGRWLVFASKRQGTWDLVLLDLNTGSSFNLTEGAEDDWDPSFHPNGRAIVFARNVNGISQIYAVCPFGVGE